MRAGIYTEVPLFTNPTLVEIYADIEQQPMDSGFQAEADIDRNGSVSFLDIGPFITLLGG